MSDSGIEGFEPGKRLALVEDEALGQSKEVVSVDQNTRPIRRLVREQT